MNAVAYLWQLMQRGRPLEDLRFMQKSMWKLPGFERDSCHWTALKEEAKNLTDPPKVPLQKDDKTYCKVNLDEICFVAPARLMFYFAAALAESRGDTRLMLKMLLAGVLLNCRCCMRNMARILRKLHDERLIHVAISLESLARLMGNILLNKDDRAPPTLHPKQSDVPELMRAVVDIMYGEDGCTVLGDTSNLIHRLVSPRHGRRWRGHNEALYAAYAALNGVVIGTASSGNAEADSTAGGNLAVSPAIWDVAKLVDLCDDMESWKNFCNHLSGMEIAFVEFTHDGTLQKSVDALPEGALSKNLHVIANPNETADDSFVCCFSTAHLTQFSVFLRWIITRKEPGINPQCELLSSEQVKARFPQWNPNHCVELASEAGPWLDGFCDSILKQRSLPRYNSEPGLPSPFGPLSSR